jgi:hypothetical protein
MRDKIGITVSLRFSAAEWGLFIEKPHPESVARQINMEVSRAINESKNWFDAFTEAEKTLVKFSHYGASDSEPRRMLDRILDYVYREE